MGMDRLGLALLPLLLLAARAVAATNQAVSIDSETVRVIGWNNDCSIALSHLGFAPLGQAILGDPVMSRVGTLTIAPGAEKAKAAWGVEEDGVGTWTAVAASDTEKGLRDEGYVRRGWIETIRPETITSDDSGRLLVSTGAFQTRSTDFPAGYPGRARLATIDYSPETAACALLVFQDASGKLRYAPRLIRVGSVTARKDRARAHLAQAWLLLDAGDRAGALQETAIAAAVCPEDALSRYRHSLQLLLDGQTEPALDELEAAAKLDPSFKKRARQDKDFKDAAWMPRFKEITR